MGVLKSVGLVIALGVGIYLMVTGGAPPTDISGSLSGDTTMRAAFYDDYGKPADVMAVRDAPIPTALAGNQVLLRVRAASINPVDWKFVNGNMQILSPWIVPHPPRVPGFDAAGVVVAVGTDVTNVAVGDEVWAYADFRQCGTLAEYVVAPDALVTAKPASMSFEEAASIPLVGVTGYQALVHHAKVQPGQKVLILGGSGGTGTFAIQLAKFLGANVTTTCSKRNEALMRELGASQVIDYRTEKWEELLEGDGFDAVYDCVGGRAHWEGAQRVLRQGGTYVTIVGDVAQMGLMGLLNKGWSIISRKQIFSGFNYKLFTAFSNNQDLLAIAKIIDDGGLRAIIDERFSLEDAAKAMQTLREGHVTGKLVVVPGLVDSDAAASDAAAAEPAGAAADVDAAAATADGTAEAAPASAEVPKTKTKKRKTKKRKTKAKSGTKAEL